jgi:hypothetical protein
VLEASGIDPDPAAPIDGRSLLEPNIRERMLLEFQGGNNMPGVPTWAATWTPEYEYAEYYDDSTGEVTFREYYDLVNDPYQLENLLFDPDPSNDPPADELARLSLQLARDRRCRGTEDVQACP